MITPAGVARRPQRGARCCRRYNARARQAHSKRPPHQPACPGTSLPRTSRFMLPVPLFWLVALLLVAATVAALVWPLLRARAPRARSSPRTSRRPTSIATRSGNSMRNWQRARSRARSAMPGSRAGARGSGAELDAMAAPAVAPFDRRGRRMSRALVLAAALPVTALVLYAAFGNPGAMRLRRAGRTNVRRCRTTQVVAMVESLATRMKEHPEDPTGWRLLARAYSAMGRYDGIGGGFHRGALRGERRMQRCLPIGPMRSRCRTSRCRASRRTLVARALALDPNHPKALSLAASAALERKDFDARNRRMAEAAGAVPAGQRRGEGDRRDDRRSGCGEARGSGGAAGVGSGSAVRRMQALRRRMRRRQMPQRPMHRRSRDASRSIRNCASGRRQSDTLFIFARAVNGPRMPLAVVRTTAAELPRDFRLDDSMAMTPAARLSTAKEVVVEARDLENRQRDALARRPAGQQRSSASPARATCRSSSTTSCAEAGKFACLASATRPQANLLPPGGTARVRATLRRRAARRAPRLRHAVFRRCFLRARRRRRWSSRARTAAARRRCCACSRA